MYTQNGPFKKLMNTNDDLNYTMWYLVALTPLTDAPSPVVHFPFFTREYRVANNLRSIVATLALARDQGKGVARLQAYK